MLRRKRSLWSFLSLLIQWDLRDDTDLQLIVLISGEDIAHNDFDLPLPYVELLPGPPV